MADDKKGGGADLGAILKIARTRPMNVALVIGKDGLAVAGDPRRGPEVMWREAKAVAGGAKGGMGVCNVVGKEIHIQFVEEYPATLKKAFKDKLREAGLKFKPVFIGADGTVDGDDDEEDADTDEGGGEAPMVADAGSADAGPNPDEQLAADLTTEFEGLKDSLSAAKTVSPVPAVKKLEGLEQMFQTEIARAPRKAMAVLSLLKKTVEAMTPAGGAAGPDPRAAEQRLATLASLEKSVDALLAEFA